MAAPIFLVLAYLFGDRLRRLLFPDTLRLFEDITGPSAADASGAPPWRPLPPRWAFEVPASLLLGVLPLTWAVYLAACLFDALLPLDATMNVLLPANALVGALVVLFLGFFAVRGLRGRRIRPADAARSLRALPRRGYARVVAFFTRMPSVYLVGLVLFFCVGWYLMASVFYVKGGMLYAGATVFSDFGPHTALIRSFSHGRNYPTEYPMFSGDGIRYHFLFLFLTGDLEFLGFRIDLAFNLLGTLGLVAFCLLLGTLAVLLVRRRSVFLLAPMLLFLRSSLAFLTHLVKVWNETHGDFVGVLVGLLYNRVFIGDTPYEDWGLWAVNVYSNQRHLLWGFAAMILALFLLLPLWRRQPQPRLLSRAAWIPDDFRPAVAAAILLSALPYFHGSVLVAAFLVLGFLALFSAGRLAFVVALVPAALSTLLQTAVFSGGAANAATPKILLGFVADDKSLAGIFVYCAFAFGVAFLLLPFLPFLYPRRHALLWLAFLLPGLFAFTVSLTPDVVVNHKFILMTFGLENLFIAGFLARLARPGPAAGKVRKRIYRFIAVVLAVFLTTTGFIDTTTFFTANRVTASIDLHSGFAAWIEAETSPDAVFLTPRYYYDDFFLAGRRSFLGWPYYAWSAGYDTYTRMDQVTWLYGGAGGDLAAFRAFCAKNRIVYAVVDDTVRDDPDTYGLDEAFFEDDLVRVASFPGEGNLVVYRIPAEP